MWTEDQWRDIVARAAPLHARGGTDFEIALDPARVAAWRAEWKRVAAADDEALFERRLRWDGIDAERVLSPARYVGPMPPWMRLLVAVLEDVRPFDRVPPGDVGPGEGRGEPPVGGGQPRERRETLPFEDLLSSLTAAARRQLRASGWNLGRSFAGSAAALPAAVLDGFEHALLRRMHWFTLRTLELEFDLARNHRGLGALLPASGTARYDAFVQRVADDRWHGLLREYPVLARQIAVTIEQWMAWVEEFAARATADAADIGTVCAIDAVPADRHDGGRAAVALRVEDGRRWLYKPRPADLDRAWGEVVRWLADRGVGMRTPAIVARPHYGWFEFIDHVDAVDCARYYENAGALLCVLYVLGANDMHSENLIAHGDQPVLVDVETLLHPLLRSGVDPLAVREAMADRVLRVGMLPRAVTAFDEHAADFSALGAAALARGLLPRPHWEAVNTDAMRIYLAHAEVAAGTHLPRRDARPEEHPDAIERGFVRTWDVIARHAATFPLAAFAGARVRLLLRNTLTHFLLMREASMPAFMRDGIHHSIRLDWLARLYLSEDATGGRRGTPRGNGCFAPVATDGAEPEYRWAPPPPPHWPLLAAEHAALERLDIPRFTAQAEGRDIYVDKVVAGDAVISGLEQVAQRLGRLDHENRGRQIALIRTALGKPAVDITTEAPSATDAPPTPPTGSGRRAAAGLVPASIRRGTDRGRSSSPVDLALQIYERLRSTAIGDDDEVTWIAVAPQRAAGRAQIGVVPLDAYAGSGGTALFLATLAHVTRRDDVQALALRALGGLRRHRVARVLAGCGEGIGLGGLGSYVYVLAQCARLLDAPSLFDDAAAWADVLAARPLAANEKLDVLGGMAGAILSLLALPTDPARETARTIGEALLDRHAEWPAGAGFGHGRAGIESALSRLGMPLPAVDGPPRASPLAASEARRTPAVGGPQAIPGAAADGGAPGAWCRGLAGDLLGPRRVHPPVAKTLTTAAVDDTLCCGRAGTADILLEIGRRAGDSTMIAEAREIGAALLEQGPDRFELPSGPALARPQLFSGEVGIGYLMLRLHDEALPCHLTLFS